MTLREIAKNNNLNIDYLISILEANKFFIVNPYNDLDDKELIKINKVLVKNGFMQNNDYCPPKNKKKNKYLLLLLLIFFILIAILDKTNSLEDIGYVDNNVNTPTVTTTPIITTTPKTTQYTPPQTTTPPTVIQNTKKELVFNWKFDYRNWTYTLEIPDKYYLKYKNIDRNTIGYNDYSVYVTDKSDDEWISSLANSFITEGKKNDYSDSKIVEFMISFVQSLEYIDDKTGTGYDEYPKYPLETLYDNGGDCEDTSILLASFIREIGFGVALIELDGHMAVGLKCSDDMPGSYYQYNDDTKYYYVETTSAGWGIGVIPDEYKGQSVNIFPVY